MLSPNYRSESVEYHRDTDPLKDLIRVPIVIRYPVAYDGFCTFQK
jgi:hypothetical protein